MDYVESCYAGPGLRIGEDVIPAGPLFGIVSKTCGLVVLCGAVLGDLGPDIDPSFPMGELGEGGQFMGSALKSPAMSIGILG